MAAAADDDAGALAAGALAAGAAAAAEDGLAGLARAPTVRAVMSASVKTLFDEQAKPAARLLQRMEAVARMEGYERDALQSLETEQRNREHLEATMASKSRKDTKIYAKLTKKLERVKKKEAAALTRLPKTQKRAENSRAALAKEEKKPATRTCTVFEPLAPALLQLVNPPEAAAAPEQAQAASSAAAAATSIKGASKGKRRRSEQGAAAQPALPAASPLPTVLGCQNLASHILDFVPLATALRLGVASHDMHLLVDPAITDITVRARALPPDPVAFAARFPLLRSLTLDFCVSQTCPHEPNITFLRRLALDTPLPTHITRLTIRGAHPARREQTSNVLDALLLVDWPRLTHLELDDLAHLLARAPTQPALATVLARLTRLGNVGNPSGYGKDYTGGWSRADTIALAAALRNGVLPSPSPAISTIAYLGHPWGTDSSVQESLVALGAILAAVPAITELSFRSGGTPTHHLAPVVQALSPNQPSLHHLRTLSVASNTPATLHPFLSALGTVGVVPKLHSLSLSWSDAQDYPMPTPLLLAPGAWPCLQSLSTPATGLFTDAADARDAYASLLLACGPRLQSLDLTAGGAWSSRITPDAFTRLLAVIGDKEVAIPWRASLHSLSLPIQDPKVSSKVQQAPIAQAAKDALLQLPSLVRLKSDDGQVGMTVGWIEAKEAGGLTKLTEVDYCRAAMDDEALLLLLAWLKTTFEADPVAAMALRVKNVHSLDITKPKVQAIGLPTLELD